VYTPYGIPNANDEKHQTNRMRNYTTDVCRVTLIRPVGEVGSGGDLLLWDCDDGTSWSWDAITASRITTTTTRQADTTSRNRSRRDRRRKNT